ncbi:phosphatidylserine decarboxylase family protein [Candidatus Endolissoclinum faulkneri L2]|uniref:Phosphatidylserine decarboxylase proenzyme n=1 Tax=Candidatus Endolissoclinum faulkneri L2 TaxID=1193729 RepID=K7ZD08_9PROT|nr:phosphatidylserine decarboxylase [Candidatus Endolissoclinum faulkneri]AFX99066.1 phosphatidylserine decarboxylase family protein [Candidatus Endolissoclinum faulkneri L2]
MLNLIITQISREGLPFIVFFAVATIILSIINNWLVLPGLVMTIGCTYFFRDPNRITPVRHGLIISPADGVVVSISQVSWPEELGINPGTVQRICIFMNVFDVHVNRIPIDCQIVKLTYLPGTFINASFDKASKQNERQLITMETQDGQLIVLVQIAGLVARRIVCKISEGQVMLAGERIGMICFGSRVDIYLPPKVAPLVALGQRCIAGETVIADLNSTEALREGVMR